MVQDLIRDSTISQIINYLSSGRLLPYPEQRVGYVVPKHFLLPSSERTSPNSAVSDAVTLCGDAEKTKQGSKISSPPDTEIKPESTALTLAVDVELQQKQVDDATVVPDPYLVTWNGNSDPENPRNWSFGKRAFVAFNISFLTFSIYIGSAIYTSSIPGLMSEFHVSLVTATLGLTLYVLAYGIGPMFLSPLQELPLLGRNPVYMATLFLFVIFQIPIVTAKNMNTVLAMRFMTGFFGSPALATGGASMADIFPQRQFASHYRPGHRRVRGSGQGWRWPMMELLWIASFAVIYLSLFLPETYEPTILLRRAQRLRKLTGNPELRTATERDEESKSAKEVMYESLVRPFVLAKEPALAFANIYLGFVYAIFYLWFEAFPLVFNGIYHFNEGVSSLPFLAFIVSGGVTYTVYCLYQKYHIAPRYARAAAANTECPHLRVLLETKCALDRPRHRRRVLPPGIFLNFQSILMYITSAYPSYAASVLAGKTSSGRPSPVFSHYSAEYSSRTSGSAGLRYLRNLLPPHAGLLVVVEIRTRPSPAVQVRAQPIGGWTTVCNHPKFASTRRRLDLG
ncbi:major facilitator superfamily domain-containing protein [Mycena sp. CBHHK59/15]|nr:major facilitator superfamily domain-containing protein [Mycena sp. CBHHK59/15]